MKKGLLITAALVVACTFGFVGAGLADKGPAELTLESTIDKAKTPKPAVFPHAAHQEKLQCADCHHSKGDDGKQVAYVEGQEIGKCESCHNSGNAEMNDKLNTFKKAGHALCKTCHEETDKAKLGKCTVCHPKK